VTLAPGMRLGSHEIISALCAGVMGKVYRFRAAVAGRAVAARPVTKYRT
jgi:hypothetical protein